MFLLAKINSEYMEKQWHETPWARALHVLLALEREDVVPAEIYYQGSVHDDVKKAFNQHAGDVLGLPKGWELTSAPKNVVNNALYIVDEANFVNCLTRLGVKPPRKTGEENVPFCELYRVDEDRGTFQLSPIQIKDDPMAQLYDRRKGSVALVPPFLPSDVSASNEVAKKYAKMANTDCITEITTKRRFDELVSEISFQEATLVLLDVDKMGKLNHKGGSRARERVDNLLKCIGITLRKSVRQSDLVCRRSGDEFIFVLFGCEPADAVSVVKRAQTNLAKALRNSSVQATLSAGVSQLRVAGQYERSLREANLALERAKKKGGHNGRVEVCSIGDAIQVFKEMHDEKKLSDFSDRFYDVSDAKRQKSGGL